MGQVRWQSAKRRAQSEKNAKPLIFLRYAPCPLRNWKPAPVGLDFLLGLVGQHVSWGRGIDWVVGL
jgi:hypothetical protein